MAIIAASRTFDGSAISDNDPAPYIRSDVKKALFSKKLNKDGAWLYFLPAYKVDGKGNGVWFKQISVRSDFGTQYKEKYYVADKSKDPAEHFANNFKLLYPEDAKTKEEVKNGSKWKVYPSYGRITQRVLFNVAYTSDRIAEGAHVLDLPSFGGASAVLSFMEGKDLKGRPKPMINDVQRCIPVFIVCGEGVQPWQISMDSNEATAIPEELADSDYLWNLDDVLVKKSNEEIIGKLSEMYDPETFNACMQGFPGFLARPVSGRSSSRAAVQEEEEDDNTPPPTPKPAVARPAIAKPGGTPAAAATKTVAAVPARPAIAKPGGAKPAPAPVEEDEDNLEGLPPNPIQARKAQGAAILEEDDSQE